MDEGRLAAGLEAFGAPLIAGVAAEGPAPSWEELLDGLMAAGQARYANCVVPLLLANPARAKETAEWARRAGREAKILYTAAAALQRELNVRLKIAGMETREIPDDFSRELLLHRVEEMHGRRCLAELDDIPWQGITVERASAYRKMADLMLDLRHAHASPC
jgi:hypothetical protein